MSFFFHSTTLCRAVWCYSICLLRSNKQLLLFTNLHVVLWWPLPTRTTCCLSSWMVSILVFLLSLSLSNISLCFVLSLHLHSPSPTSVLLYGCAPSLYACVSLVSVWHSLIFDVFLFSQHKLLPCSVVLLSACYGPTTNCLSSQTCAWCFDDLYLPERPVASGKYISVSPSPSSSLSFPNFCAFIWMCSMHVCHLFCQFDTHLMSSFFHSSN